MSEDTERILAEFYVRWSKVKLDVWVTFSQKACRSSVFPIHNFLKVAQLNETGAEFKMQTAINVINNFCLKHFSAWCKCEPVCCYSCLKRSHGRWSSWSWPLCRGTWNSDLQHVNLPTGYKRRLFDNASLNYNMLSCCHITKWCQTCVYYAHKQIALYFLSWEYCC
jgi:hypothetical protein